MTVKLDGFIFLNRVRSVFFSVKVKIERYSHTERKSTQSLFFPFRRFCSQEFTLEKFDVQVHLSNNSIQKHYQNGRRSSKLPESNMWSSDEFKEFLSSIGKLKLFVRKIHICSSYWETPGLSYRFINRAFFILHLLIPQFVYFI